MGGKIWIDSQLNKGSDFHFTIKFDLPKSKKDVKLISYNKLKGLKVLLFLNNKTTMELLSGWLAAIDCKVITADNIEQINQLLTEPRSDDSHPQFLLVDSHDEELSLIKNIRKIQN